MSERAKKKCPGCGKRFVDRSRNASRVYCIECSPPRLAGQGGRVQREAQIPVAVKITGKPFTLKHFRGWVSQLRLVDDHPFVLEQWEELFLEDLFAGMAGGWLREAWLIVPEGNGKSTLVAVLVLYCVEFASEAAIPIAAASRDQAEIIYQLGNGFVRRSEALRGRFVCKPGLRELVHGAAKAKIFASDAGTGDGVIPFPLEVIDELHRHGSLDLYRTWAGKLDKEGAVLVVISTAGAPGSEFEDLREEMRQAATDATVEACFGRYVGPTSLLHEYAVPEDGDVEDLDLVKQANPSARITVESLAAKRSRPSWTLAHWRRLTCNLPTRSGFAAITEAEWAGRRTDRSIPAGAHISVGLDVGWKWDTTALVPLWVADDGVRLLGDATVLVPPRDGSMLDGRLIEQAILDLQARNPIDVIVMDMSRAEQLAQWASDLGITVIDRGKSNSAAVEDFERFMEGLRSDLWHTGSPDLTRHAMNAVARILPQGDTRFDRPSKTRQGGDQDARVIDALDAAAMVNAVAGREQPVEVWAASW